MFAKVSLWSVLAVLIAALAGSAVSPPRAADQEKPKDAEAKAKEGLKLPEGVIHVALPPGEVRMENIARNGKPLIRLSVDKTVVEAQTMFLGDSKGATRFESTKEGIHWAPASGGKGFTFGNGAPSVREPGSTIDEPDYCVPDKLKAGSVFLTTPSIRFVFGTAAKPRPRGREGAPEAKPSAQAGPNVPDGVIHLALPAGQVRMERIETAGEPFLRVTVGKTVVEAPTCFLGDDKGAGRWVATKFGVGTVYLHDPGSTFNHQVFSPVDKLKAGSVYVTTPSINFQWGIDPRPRR